METILIATDFSSAATNALMYGADLAKYLSAKIILVNAFSIPLGGYGSMVPYELLNEVQKAAVGTLRENRKELIARMGYDPGIEIEAEPGTVHSVVNDAINKYGAELVVMGMVGEAGPFKRSVIGSNALNAGRSLSVPVIIVPETFHYVPIKKISFACDINHLEETTLLHMTKALCVLFNAQLEIVNVIQNQSEPVTAPLAHEVVEHITKQIAHKTVTINSEDPGLALEEYFKVHKADLVILNPKKHSLFNKLFGQSVTRKLVFFLNMPMLLIPST